jgi:hypothetical protein
MNLSVKERGFTDEELGVASDNANNIVLTQEDTAPTRIHDFAAFKRKTFQLIDWVLQSKDIPSDVEDGYEIPSLYDIIVRHDFKEEDREKVNFLLNAHECRLKGTEFDFQSGMLNLCKRK